jgi:hypothetical protein
MRRASDNGVVRGHCETRYCAAGSRACEDGGAKRLLNTFDQGGKRFGSNPPLTEGSGLTGPQRLIP